MHTVTGKKRIPTIGALIPAIDHYYQRDLLRSLENKAEERECNLLVFCGNPLKTKKNVNGRGKLVFSLPDSSILDGLIVSTGTISNYMDIDDLLPVLQQFKDIPIVSLSYKLDSAYNINIDNAKSLETITDHLIDVHGFRDIVYVSGPKKSVEAEDRTTGYKKSLKKHRIAFREEKVIYGDYFNESGKNAARYIINELENFPDAVVCANDEMAFGLCTVFDKNGIKVPEDIAVTGFDNNIYSMLHSPSLTTASQPMDEMSSTAIDIIIDIKNGKKVKKEFVLNTEFIARESCSCENIRSDVISIQNYCNKIADMVFEKGNSIEEVFQNNRDKIVETLIGSLHLTQKPISRFYLYIDELFESMVKDFTAGKAPVALSKTLERFYFWSFKESHEEIEWKAMMLAMRSILFNLFPQADKAEYILHFSLQALFSMDVISKKKYHRSLYEFNNNFFLGNDFSGELNSASSHDDLVQIISNNCDLFSFEQCYLCFLSSPVQIDNYLDSFIEKNFTLLFGKNSKNIYTNIEYSSARFLPKEITDDNAGNNLSVFPLNSEGFYHGFFACSIEETSNPITSTLRQQLSNVAEKLRLIGKLEQNTKEIERISIHDKLTGLLNRRGFYAVGQAFLKEASRKNQEVLLLFGDMDKLKEINDTFGHHAGDSALIFVSECLKNALRDDDILSRYGGDEFAAILLNQSNSDNSKLILDRIYDTFEKFNQNSNLEYKVLLSLGFAVLKSDEQKDLDMLIEEADKMLYAEKEKRKNHSFLKEKK